MSGSISRSVQELRREKRLKMSTLHISLKVREVGGSCRAQNVRRGDLEIWQWHRHTHPGCRDRRWSSVQSYTSCSYRCHYSRAKNSTSIRSSGVTVEWKVSLVRSRTSLAATEAASRAAAAVKRRAPRMAGFAGGVGVVESFKNRGTRSSSKARLMSALARLALALKGLQRAEQSDACRAWVRCELRWWCCFTSLVSSHSNKKLQAQSATSARLATAGRLIQKWQVENAGPHTLERHSSIQVDDNVAI